METAFINKLEPLLDAVGREMDLYVPKKVEQHFVYDRYNPDDATSLEFNDIRTCTPVKEFLFPMRELAAALPKPLETDEVKPFAVFGLKDCDLRCLEILDKVFAEQDFEDQLYIKRRDNMFIIASDCYEPGKSCFCSLLDGQGFAKNGFDLNVSKIRDGFIVEAGSQKGQDFIKKHSQLFTDAPDTLSAQRDENRAEVQKQLEQNNSEYKLDSAVNEIVANSVDSEVFDAEAKNCVECQACTRVCPTCHCFYLYDTKQKDYFTKMKMWDSCLRQAYAAVAGGANPRKMLGDRIKHRLMHKFVYFLDRYGINMCVGCGRCMDVCIGGIDTRAMLKKLNEELKVAK